MRPGDDISPALRAGEGDVERLIRTARIAPDGRCCVLDRVLGAETVAGLLDYAERREADFTPATVHRRGEGRTVDASARDCLQLRDLGPFKAAFKSAVLELASWAAPRLGVEEQPLSASEFELCAYGDGGGFRRHADSRTRPTAVRALTCVYYFSESPPRFGGGQLRLHPWPVPLPGSGREPLDIEPQSDSLVMFPSMLPHEVLPVHSHSDAWRARRFNLTCWLWRPQSPAG